MNDSPKPNEQKTESSNPAWPLQVWWLIFTAVRKPSFGAVGNKVLVNGDHYLVSRGVPSAFGKQDSSKITVQQIKSGAAVDFANSTISNMRQPLSVTLNRLRSQAATVKSAKDSNNTSLHLSAKAEYDEMALEYMELIESHNEQVDIIEKSERVVWVFSADQLLKTLTYGTPIEYTCESYDLEAPKKLNADLPL